jgi:hypothetical protein
MNAALTKHAVPVPSSFCGTSKPLLNSAGFCRGLNWGLAVSEHRIMRCRADELTTCLVVKMLPKETKVTDLPQHTPPRLIMLQNASRARGESSFLFN